MRNRINTTPAGADLSYRKKGIRSFADGDDYGAIAPPDDFHFEPIPNHPNGSFYGYQGWSQNFYKLMAEHPVHIDPCDAFACRWMNCMLWMRLDAGIKKLVQYRGINPGHDDFYDAEILTVMGIQEWIRHTCLEIEKALLEEQDPVLKDNLEQMLICNRNIIEGAPKTLREACQWICWFNMASREYNRDGAGCQLDETLRPYYERDIQAGDRIVPE